MSCSLIVQCNALWYHMVHMLLEITYLLEYARRIWDQRRKDDPALLIKHTSILHKHSVCLKTVIGSLDVVADLDHKQAQQIYVYSNLFMYTRRRPILCAIYLMLYCFWFSPTTTWPPTIISFLFSILFYFTDIKFYIYLCTLLCVYILLLSYLIQAITILLWVLSIYPFIKHYTIVILS